MTAALFLGFLAVVAATVLMLAGRYLPRGTAAAIWVGLPAWLLYVGLLGYFGVVRNAALRPPGIAFILGPVALFVVLFAARAAGAARWRFRCGSCSGCKATGSASNSSCTGFGSMASPPGC